MATTTDDPLGADLQSKLPRSVLPTFGRRPSTNPTDPPLPGTPTSTTTATPAPPADATAPRPAWGTDPNPSPSGRPGPTSPSDAGGTSRPTNTSGTDGGKRWRAGGNPSAFVEPFGGLLILAAGGFALAVVWLTGRTRTMRVPTVDQAEAMAAPLARILCRHLPMDAVGPDVIDVGTLGAALRDYGMNDDDGRAPLFPRIGADPFPHNEGEHDQ